MTKETEHKVLADAFCEMRRTALSCMQSITKSEVEDSWDGVMKAGAKVEQYGDAEEKSAFDMARDKWLHAFFEQWTYGKLHEAEEMISHEVAAANGEAHHEESEAQAVKTVLAK